MYGLLQRLKVVIFISFAFLPSAAFGYDVYIPHISGTGGFWQDTLHVNNTQLAEASFAVTLFDGGTEAYHDSFSINGLGSLRIDLKSLVPGIAQGTGIVNYDSEHLYFRLSHESKSGGGAAEFRLTGDRHPVLGFFFSDYTPEVAWKAIALANMNPAAADVRLYAVADMGIQYCVDLTIAPFSKAVGLYGKWFPFVAFGSIDKIFAVSSQDLCGVTISGNAAESFLLFTAAAEVPIEDPQSSLVCPGDTDEDGDGYSANQGDCDDDDASIHPGAMDSCGDGIDQDCSGEDCPPPEKPQPIDNDGDGYTAGSDCNDNDATIHPGAAEILSDGIDQDCDGKDLTISPPSGIIIIDGDYDGDGYTESGGDCNDNDASIHPGATEICGNDIDEDCDGYAQLCQIKPLDPFDPSRIFLPAYTDDDGDGYTENGGDCNDADASIYPGATEICGDGIDQDCDGYDQLCRLDPILIKPPSGINLLGFED